MSDAPPKFINEGGVRKINPAWKQWKAGGGASSSPAPPSIAPPMRNEATALPVVTSLADQKQHLGDGTQVSASMAQSLEHMQSAKVSNAVGMTPEDTMEKLSIVFAKYEIPMGLLNKLYLLSEFNVMEMIVDDSGSMNAKTDSKLPGSSTFMTRWQEVEQRLIQMFEIMAYVPCPPCYVRFLNRKDCIEITHNPGESPEAHLGRVIPIIRQNFQSRPQGTTPALERISESLARYSGKKCLRYFFGDGVPNGGDDAQEKITKNIKTRSNPEQNPFTFLSCTNNDDDVAWMKECEEQAKFCAEYDDYNDESAEILHDQGIAFSYTFGMHLVGQLIGAACPEDLDALDEAAPLTKQVLDSLLGYTTADAEFAHYFREFINAQKRARGTEKVDAIKKEYLPVWEKNYQAFVTAKSGKDIPQVQEFRAKVLDATSSSCVIC